MKLPFLLKISLFLLLFTFLFFSKPYKSLAAPVPIPTSTGLQESTANPGTQNWVADPDVTFAGKSAARAADFVDWTLKNYQWSVNDTPLSAYWANIRNIVYVLLIIAIMAAAAVMIITHGNNVGVFSFIRLLFIAILLITLSFALIRLLYQLTDIFQGFFLNAPGRTIGSSDLFSIAIKYKDFQGLRLSGTENDEAVFTSVNLVKLTTITYMVMAGILLVRKIVLWFFIIVSPIFPLLIFYIPLRNTAKIWIGEFFRWLLYAPLFSILLSGLVSLWRTQISILPFNFIPNTPYYNPPLAGQQPYPTAINILLGGPGQQVSLTNSLNYNDTFIQYVVALIMLWMVIFLPWLLLRIFLDYIGTVSLQNNNEVSSFIKTTLGRIPQPEFVKNITQNGNTHSSEQVNAHVRNSLTSSPRLGNFGQGFSGTTPTAPDRFSREHRTVENIQNRTEVYTAKPASSTINPTFKSTSSSPGIGSTSAIGFQPPVQNAGFRPNTTASQNNASIFIKPAKNMTFTGSKDNEAFIRPVAPVADKAFNQSTTIVSNPSSNTINNAPRATTPGSLFRSQAVTTQVKSTPYTQTSSNNLQSAARFTPSSQTADSSTASPKNSAPAHSETGILGYVRKMFKTDYSENLQKKLKKGSEIFKNTTIKKPASK